MELKKIGIVNELKRSGVMLGIKLVKKLSDGMGVFELYELAEALGVGTATKKSGTVTHRKVTKLPPTSRGRRPKTVLQYSRDGEYLASYASVADAARKCSASCNGIRNCWNYFKFSI